MSGVCPVPFEKTSTAFNAVFSLRPPPPQFSGCEGGTDQVISSGEPIVTIECCPSPGPPGPAGPAGPTGPSAIDLKLNGTTVIAGATALNILGENASLVASGMVGDLSIGLNLKNNGTTVVERAQFLNFISDNFNLTTSGGSPPTGADYEVLATTTYRGCWIDTAEYNQDDIVTDAGSLFICRAPHTSDMENRPDVEADACSAGGTYWLTMASGIPPELSADLIEDATNWFDGVVDWMKDVKNWNWEDWATLLAAGTGLYLAGTALNDLFEFEPQDPNDPADSRFTGTLTYNDATTLPTLKDTIEALLERSGVTTHYVDAALASTTVQFVMGSNSSALNVLELLAQAYFLDVVDAGDGIKVFPRSSTSVATLTDEDLGFTADAGSSVPYTAKRMQGIDLPQTVRIKYISETNGFNVATQETSFFTHTNGQVVEVEFPFVLSDAYAKELSERMLVESHTERMSFAFDTSYEWFDLEPGDVITLDTDSFTGDVRIREVKENDDGRLSFTAVEMIDYTASGASAATIPAYSDTVYQIGFSGGFIFEPTHLIDGTNSRLFIAPHGFGADGWPGCNIYVSNDNGSSYTQIGTAVTPATWGRVASAAAAPSDHLVWDNATTIQVELRGGTLTNKSALQVQNGFNWALYGQEIIGFTTATLVTGTTYNLTGLLRGRRGTEPYMSTHVANEAFILLDDAMIEYNYDIGTQNLTRLFKFVTIGSDLSKAEAIPAQPSGVSRRPWTVATLVATRVTSPAVDWNITWQGRNQFEPDLMDSNSTQNPPEFAGFLVQILNGVTVIRSATVFVPNFVYTEAMQTADWGSLQSSLKVRVSQLDLRVGPGFDNTQTFTA